VLIGRGDPAPRVKVVLQRFPQIKLLNEKVSDPRRALHHEMIDVRHEDMLNGTRWLLRK
jgi:hypothetical protein